MHRLDRQDGRVARCKAVMSCVACPPAENFLSNDCAWGVAPAQMRKLIALFDRLACVCMDDSTHACVPCIASNDRPSTHASASFFHHAHAASSRLAHARNPTRLHADILRRGGGDACLARAVFFARPPSVAMETGTWHAGIVRGLGNAAVRWPLQSIPARRRSLPGVQKKMAAPGAAIRGCDVPGAISARLLPAARHSRPATAGR